MGKNKHSLWSKVRDKNVYSDDYGPKNKVTRKRIENKIEIKKYFQEEK